MEKSVKIFQYFMLVVLFSLAFILPIFAVNRQAEEAAGQTAGEGEVRTGAEAQTGTKGKIVIDAGHGGF